MLEQYICNKCGKIVTVDTGMGIEFYSVEAHDHYTQTLDLDLCLECLEAFFITLKHAKPQLLNIPAHVRKYARRIMEGPNE